jgi:peptide chain release factor 3
MDREAREPLELLDEISNVLALDTAPMVWPMGSGRDFKGTYDLTTPRVNQMDTDAEDLGDLSGPDDPAITGLMGEEAAARWREEVDLVQGACGRFDLEAFRHGTLTPVYFGSALKNFGVRQILDAFVNFAPPPRAQKAAQRTIDANEPAMTGIVFKIQANMDPNHRDRIAFMRVTSGKLTRGMKATVSRTGKVMALQAPQFFPTGACCASAMR